MGRPKSYRREDLVAKAMELFRSHGFAGTSTQLLLDELGVNRFSLYAEFGSKQGLFEAVLARYEAEVLGRHFGPLEEAGAGLEQVRAVLRSFACAAEGPAAGRGCLLCNTAVELGRLDPSGFVARYLARLPAAFENALHTAGRGGALRADVDPADEARLLTASVLGMFVLVRAGSEGAVLEGAARAAIAHLDSIARS